MEKPADYLEALRQVLSALEPLEGKDRELVVRWACEKLAIAFGLAQASIPSPPPPGHSPGTPTPATSAPGQDIKAFVQQKNPTSENQLIATVAYYYQFVAPSGERKGEIFSKDIPNACRLAGRAQLKNPIKALHNAMRAGLLDKGTARGAFRLSTVGENLVAMALPEGSAQGSGSIPRRSRKGQRRGKPKASRRKV